MDKPVALRLADMLNSLCVAEFAWPYLNDAATELRLLHAENESLRNQNTDLDAHLAAQEAVMRQALNALDLWADYQRLRREGKPIPTGWMGSITANAIASLKVALKEQQPVQAKPESSQSEIEE